MRSLASHWLSGSALSRIRGEAFVALSVLARLSNNLERWLMLHHTDVVYDHRLVQSHAGIVLLGTAELREASRGAILERAGIRLEVIMY